MEYKKNVKTTLLLYNANQKQYKQYTRTIHSHQKSIQSYYGNTSYHSCVAAMHFVAESSLFSTKTKLNDKLDNKKTKEGRVTERGACWNYPTIVHTDIIGHVGGKTG